MPDKLKKLGKEIVKQFAVSFFFCCLVFVILYFLVSGKIAKYVTLINSLTIKTQEVDIQPVKFDIVSKKLKTYPRIGVKWATLKIDEIDLNLAIYQDDTLDILKKGVGHFLGSWFPGEGGSIILDAHNNKGMFRRLPELSEGSVIVIEADYGTFTYKLTRSDIINKTETDKLPIQSDEELLMLYTCYPVTAVGMTSKRLVLYAELVGADYAN